MIHPEAMTKIAILGPKNRMDDVITELYDLGLLHIEDYADESGDYDIGEPFDEAEQLSERLVKTRSVAAKLPNTDTRTPVDRERDVAEIGDEIEALQTELDAVRETRQENEQLLEKLDLVKRLGISLDDITEYDALDTYLGFVEDHTFTAVLEEGRYELVADDDLILLFVDRRLPVDEALRDSGFDAADTEDLLPLQGSVAAQRAALQQEITELRDQERSLEQEQQELAAAWKHRLEQQVDELSRELDKAEAPLQFVATEKAFQARGWIPAADYDRVVAALEDVTDNRIHIEEVDHTHEEAPVAHDNPEPVQPLESLLRLYGTPKYSEVDPTFLLLTFPALFGFMLGDIGYGITTFAVFYLFSRTYPGARDLWVSLMYASAATIVFGLLYGELFGYEIFGHASALSAAFGWHVFEQVPIVFPRAHALDQVLLISVAFGVFHVNAGLAIGAYNEYRRHGWREAVLAKGSWFVIEAGAVFWAVAGLQTLGAAVLTAGVVMLYFGEHIEGIVEIPSLLSNILSYLRIFGVSIAVVSLAKLVNVIAEPLFQSGSMLLVAFGAVFLVVGHTINTFIKMMEAGLQGIRLHYVEFFTKFWEGGGEYYTPFGAPVREH